MGSLWSLLAANIPILILLLVGVVLALTAAGWKEVAAGGLAVAAVALYYVGLWLVRDRIARKYEFYLK